MHDSTAVMAVLAPHFFTQKTAVFIDVEANSELCNGVCIPGICLYYCLSSF